MKIFMGLIVCLLLATASLAFAREGAESAGGGMPMKPIRPKAIFEYKCVATWIADGIKAGSHAAMSQAEFVLNNSRYGYNKQSLTWKHGYARSLNPIQRLTDFDGQGEALELPVTPHFIGMDFSYSRKGVPITDPQAYDVNLRLGYGISKSASSHDNLEAGTQGSLGDRRLVVTGRMYSNGEGESQWPVYVFSVVCEK